MFVTRVVKVMTTEKTEKHLKNKEKKNTEV